MFYAYRCETLKCLEEDTSNKHYIESEQAPTTKCPHCDKINWKRLEVIHLIKEADNGIIKGSKFSKGKRFTFGCDRANNRYENRKPGVITQGTFSPRDITCHDCLINDGHTFNPETLHFDLKPEVSALE